MTLKDKQRIADKMRSIERRLKAGKFRSVEEYDRLIARLRVLRAEMRTD